MEQNGPGSWRDRSSIRNRESAPGISASSTTIAPPVTTFTECRWAGLKLCRVRRVRASAWSGHCPGDLRTAGDGHRRGNGQGRRIFAAACGVPPFCLDLQASGRTLPPFERMMVGKTPVPVGEKETDLRLRFRQAPNSKDANEVSESHIHSRFPRAHGV